MKYLLGIFSIIAFVLSFGIVRAAGQSFAGIISDTKATEIRLLEEDGFVCTVPGTTIQVLQKGKRGYQPTSFFIPSGTNSKTKYKLLNNQKIIGKYLGKTEITCVYEAVPPIEVTVTLDTITMYGNSFK